MGARTEKLRGRLGTVHKALVEATNSYTEAERTLAAAEDREARETERRERRVNAPDRRPA